MKFSEESRPMSVQHLFAFIWYSFLTLLNLNVICDYLYYVEKLYDKKHAFNFVLGIFAFLLFGTTAARRLNGQPRYGRKNDTKRA